MAYEYSLQDIDAELAKRQVGGAASKNFEYSQADIDAEIARRSDQSSAASEVARPFLRAAKNIAVGTIGAAGDIAQEAFALPGYLGNLGARAIEKAYYGDNLIKPYDFSKVNTASPAVREAFDSATGGITKPRNKLEEYSDIGGEILGGVVGPGAISKTAGAIASAPKKLVEKLAKVKPETVAAFEEAGVIPTLGQASDSNIAKFMEAGLERFPGSSGVIQKAKEDALKQVQTSIKNVADAALLSKEGAGQLIQEGAKADVKRFKYTSEKVFTRLNRYVKKDEAIDAANISSKIDEIVSSLPREAGANKLARENKAFEIMNDLKNDINANGGKLDYKTAKFYRSRIASETNQKYIVGDTETGELKQLYGALSEDLRGAFRNKGEEAEKAFNNANEFYEKGIANIENKLSKIIKNQYPERVYEALLGGTKEGPTRARAIMKALDPEERTILRSTVLNDIGKNSNGEFSPEVFLKNYSKLEGKNALLSSEQVKSLDNLAEVLGRIKSVSSRANTSNTATIQNLYNLGTGVLLGSLTDIATAGKTIGGAYISSKLFTSPKFINWLAETPKIKTQSELARHYRKLAAIAASDAALRPEIEKYLQNKK